MGAPLPAPAEDREGSAARRPFRGGLLPSGNNRLGFSPAASAEAAAKRAPKRK
jgi:hypothetical protein